MYTPIATSALTLLASLHGHRDVVTSAHWARDIVYALAGLTGLIGTGFHLYNVGKRPGGFCWQNLFYGAPLGAPAALSLAGMTGFLAERVRDNAPGAPPDVLGLPAGRVVAALTGAGLVGTAMEAGLLHFRGAFHNPAMLLPVTAPPVAAAMLAAAAVGKAERPRRITRWWLRMTALLGVAGSVSTRSGSHATWAGGGTGRRTSRRARRCPRRLPLPGWRWPDSPRSGSSRTIPMTEHVTSGPLSRLRRHVQAGGPSWNDKTREVIDARLATGPRPAFFSCDEWKTLEALCDRVMPQPEGRPHAPLAAYVDRQLLEGRTKGYRFAGMPQPGEAWKRALAALDEASLRGHGRPFAFLPNRIRTRSSPDGGRVIRGGGDARNAVEDLLDLACDPRCRRSLLRPP